MQDTGKPIWEARVDIASCADAFEYYGGLAPAIVGVYVCVCVCVCVVEVCSNGKCLNILELFIYFHVRKCFRVAHCSMYVCMYVCTFLV